ncbi:MAG: SAM-dependent methyltransferase [Treponemataceae bacterium]|nr:SAM-dependent methyltransferase [Treponemataceae bacterium]
MNSSDFFTDKDIDILISVTLSKPVAGAEADKVKIQRADTGFQIARFKGPQVFHQNADADAVRKLLNDMTAHWFHTVDARTENGTITILTSKKGKTTVLRKPAAGSGNQPKSPLQQLTAVPHNRTKNYIIPEGKPVLFLEKLGVMTSTGAVHAQKYDKFRQINRFLEYVDDILPVLEDTDGRPLRVIDFGCGKAYLTFALYYYLVEIRGLTADVFGLDLKKQVIEDCGKLAENCGYNGLHFSTGDIAAYREGAAADDTVDLVITLHACDTATDYALAYAVEHGARAILSVPCCQHELNTALGKTVTDAALNPMLKYGIVKERFSALATDVLRAGELEAAGYKTQLLEFIDMEGTPKNLLIRATRREGEKKAAGNPYAELQAALGVELTLGKLLR